jgi:hypothetical protein
VTLYYDPSGIDCQAGQLGPKGCRILVLCPGCVFSIKPLVFLGPIDLGGPSEYCEYCFWVGFKDSKDEPVEGYLIGGFHEKSPHSSLVEDLKYSDFCGTVLPLASGTLIGDMGLLLGP